jgi:hypothetical protein
LVNLSRASDCNSFLENLNNFINTLDIQNLIHLENNLIEWEVLIEGISNIYIKIAEKNWNNRDPYPKGSPGKIKQTLIKIGKARIYKKITSSLDEPTIIYNNIIEKPNAELRDNYRGLYNLNLTKFENFKYIQGKFFFNIKG